MNTEIVEYNITDSTISQLRSQYAEISDIKVVTAALSHVRRLRTDVEKRRKELKEDALEWGRKVDGEAKRITALLFEIEEPLKLTKKEHDDEKERLRAEKARIENERVDTIKQRIEEINQYLYKGLKSFESNSLRKIINDFNEFKNKDEFDYQDFREQSVITKQNVLIKLEEDLAEKLLDEKKRADEFYEMQKATAELEAQKVENAKHEEALRLEREAFRQQQEEQQRIAAEVQRKAQEELAKQQAEIDARRKEQEAKEAALEAERQRLEAQRLGEAKKSQPEVKPELRNIMNVQQRMQLDPNEPKDAKDMVSILRSEYEELLDRSELLEFLDAAGIDDWQGYELALQMQKDYKNGEDNVK